ncbi:MAG TPA: zf-HC2 domain-containing protein [Gaiellaceae bacterium]|nr:zf-HC2 domain-containing protein [Gaiellaceae bacterium]
MRPARCDRSREAISLRLDGVLSLFESALLDRHLRRCADCRDFAAGAAAQTQLLRSAVLEQPLRPVVIPAGRRHVRRVAAGALTAVASVAAAAAVTLSPGGNNNSGAASASAHIETGAPVLVVVAAHPTPGVRETVPRLTMQPANVADGPVHGLFNTPVSVRA